MAPERGQTLARASDSASRAGWGYAPPPPPVPYPQFAGEDAPESQNRKVPPCAQNSGGAPQFPPSCPGHCCGMGDPRICNRAQFKIQTLLRPHTVSPKLCHSYLPLNVKFLFLMQNTTINRLSQTKLKCPLLSSGERGGGGCLLSLNKQTRLGS